VLTAKDKTKVERWAKKWRNRLLLNAYTVEVEFCLNPDPDDRGEEVCKAEVHIDPKYLRIEIKIYPFFWEQTGVEQERTIVHELVHTHSHGLKMLACESKRPSNKRISKENETLVEIVTNIMWDAYS